MKDEIENEHAGISLREDDMRAVSSYCVFIDREALHRDFPSLGDYVASRGIELEDWFTQEFGYISESQFHSDKVNFEYIPSDAPGKTGRRQVDLMGRNAHVEAKVGLEEHALFDVKGCGILPGLALTNTISGNGFLSMSAAIKESLMSSVLGRICPDGIEYSGDCPPAQSCAIYGIILYDIDYSLGSQKFVCAGLVREPTYYRDNSQQWPLSKESIMIDVQFEIALRSIGTTSISKVPFEVGEKVLTRISGGEIMRISCDALGGLPDATWFMENIDCETDHFVAGFMNIQKRMSARKPGEVRICDFDHFTLKKLYDWDKLMVSCSNQPLGFGCALQTRALEDACITEGFKTLTEILERELTPVSDDDRRFFTTHDFFEKSITYPIWKEFYRKYEEFSVTGDIGLLRSFLSDIFAKLKSDN